eukprot:evm.model.NODE_30589_length_12170_cov_35.313229.1
MTRSTRSSSSVKGRTRIATVILAASGKGIDSLRPDNTLAAAIAAGLSMTLLINKERCGEEGARGEEEE